MKRTAIVLLAFATVVWSEEAKTLPEQAERGRVLFLDASSQTSCGNCHGIGHYGTKGAPDLQRWAPLAPRAIGTAIRATITEYVKTVKLKNGETLPALIVTEGEKSLQLYNLTKIPLAPEQVDREGIESVSENSTWKHPPSGAPYTAEQLADIVGFIRWAATGSAAEVDAALLRGL